MNCEETSSPSVTHYYYSLPSEAKHNLSLIAAECVHSVESANGVGSEEEGVIFQEKGEVYLIACTQRWVNIL